MATFNLRMQKFRKKVERTCTKYYLWPYWFYYQTKRFNESYWPAYKSEKNKKNLLRCLSELLFLTVYWGCIPFHYFRYGLYKKNFQMKKIKGYIPESVVYYRILPRINTDHLLLDNKNICDDLLKSNNIPTPQTILKIRNSLLFDKKGELIRNNSLLQDYLSSQNAEEIIAKPADCGSGGKQIVIFKKKGDNYFYKTKTINFSFLKKNFTKDWILQEVIINSPLLKEMHPSSLNSFRVMTFLDKDKPLVLYAMLKVGNNLARTDNAHTNGVYVGVDLLTGKLFEKAYDENLNEFTQHPLTKIKFKDKIIPQFEQVINLAKRAALIFPETKFIGWDIALTKKGPIILEGNSSPGLTIIQRTHGGMTKFYSLVNGTN